MLIEETEVDGVHAIRVNGEVDLYTSPKLRTAILKAAGHANVPVAVDLGEVAYMDSSGVATLIEGLKLAGQKGGSFFLVGPSTPVMKVLQLSRLDTVFTIQERL